jgi:hypothetical protein
MNLDVNSRVSNVTCFEHTPNLFFFPPGGFGSRIFKLFSALSQGFLTNDTESGAVPLKGHSMRYGILNQSESPPKTTKQKRVQNPNNQECS